MLSMRKRTLRAAARTVRGEELADLRLQPGASSLVLGHAELVLSMGERAEGPTAKTSTGENVADLRFQLRVPTHGVVRCTDRPLLLARSASA